MRLYVGLQEHETSDPLCRFTATVPAVIQQLDYSSANAQLLTIPIYVFAMIMTIIFAFWSDRVQQRSPFIMIGYCIAAAGFIGQLAIPHTSLPGLTYGFLFPVAAGLYCPFIHIVCWTGKPLSPCGADYSTNRNDQRTTSRPPRNAPLEWVSSSQSATWEVLLAQTFTLLHRRPSIRLALE